MRFTRLSPAFQNHIQTHTHTHIQNITCIHMLVTHICLIRCFFYLSLLLFSVWCFIFSFTLMRYFVFILCCTATTYLSTQVQTYLQTYYQQQQNIYICGLVRCNIWLCVCGITLIAFCRVVIHMSVYVVYIHIQHPIFHPESYIHSYIHPVHTSIQAYIHSIHTSLYMFQS